jgi:hypothetical protein
MGFGLKDARDAIDATAERLAGAAEDTRTAMTALAVLGVAALGVALVALAVAMRGQRA